MAVLQFGNIPRAALRVYFFPYIAEISSSLILFICICGIAFGGGSDNPHLPHNHEMDQVVYTGTHDNDTVSPNFSLELLLFEKDSEDYSISN